MALSNDFFKALEALKAGINATVEPVEQITVQSIRQKREEIRVGDSTFEFAYLNSSGTSYLVDIGAYGSTVTSNSPVGYWRFDDGVGNTALDSSTNSNAGTVTNVQQESGSLLLSDASPAYKWDGVSGDVNMGSPSILDNIFAGGGSFETWIDANSFGEGDGAYVASKSWIIELVSDNGTAAAVQFYHPFSGDDGRWGTSTRVIVYGQTSSIVVTYDKDSATNNALIYIDGVSVPVAETSTPTGTAHDESGSTLLIGNGTAGGRTFDGTIDEVALYSSILSTSTPLAHYNTGVADQRQIIAGFWVVRGS